MKGRLSSSRIARFGPKAPTSGSAGGSYVDFGRYAAYPTHAAGKKDGLLARELPEGLGEVSLDFTTRAPHTASDDSGFYNGGRYHWGSLTSPVCGTRHRFDTLLPSWNAATPAGTWVQLEVRVRYGGLWTGWFNMGVWASGTESVRRHSVDGQKGAWEVSTDILHSRGTPFADAYRWRLTLFTEEWGVSPLVRGVFVTTSDSRCHGEVDLSGGEDRVLRGQELAVPARSQMAYGEGGEAWCSPASLSMVMAYWAGKTGDGGLDRSVPTVAEGTYDHVYRGNGNWSFNTAYASSFGLVTFVGRFASLGQVERWMACGVPVVASVAWGRGELSGAPSPASDGHLLVIRGFDPSGDVVANDPAGCDDSEVRRVYRRHEFARNWASGSGGVAYLVYPNGWPIPDVACAARGGHR